MQKVRTVVYLNPAEAQALRKLGDKSGASVGELVRRAVAEWLKKQK